MGRSDPRARDPWFGEPFARDWQWPKLVHCSRCDRQATVFPLEGGLARLRCPSCGLAREASRAQTYVSDPMGRPIQVPVGRQLRGPLDPESGRPWTGSTSPPPGHEPTFGTRLWLTATCCGGRLLWAFNETHLALLRRYIDADIRHRRRPKDPRFAQLPGWMKEAKHRDEILRHIDRLAASVRSG